ncbi:MAG: chain-length determining protein [Limosilactobacillus oris]|jgi:capsular polysaccharide biosynthesis protein|uniref:YveK family protein n=1 Tax=Limosilactobacillus oris TaxID=1632 RepID=UPI002432C0D7|nr:chain-length determining protein [Limosilactobacillus oris]MCH3910263.1 chain-length determining protein [Limosilactobacillus oris]MCH3939390.1 chain-length determining protein [Limosilactobacillus oris]MCI1980730.1 chain-length determining protein [Limosilactobacillus oris]MCI2043124.1 chain-length determining protein [Limosilactobacillus oris]
MKKNEMKKSNIYLKYITIILVMMILGGGGMFALAKHRQHSFFIAKRSILISHTIHEERNYNTSFNSSDQQMMETYSDIIEDPTIGQVAHKRLPKQLKKQYSANDLSDMTDASTSQQSLVLILKIKADTKNAAIKITNATSEAVKQKLPSIQPGAGKVRLLSPATTAKEVTTPHVKKYVAIGIALGGMVGLIICFVEETWNRLL